MYSFDVFDTLITRTTANPKGIFKLMQKSIYKEEKFDLFLRTNFYELRVGAEELARLQMDGKSRQEVTLDDIYEAMGTTVCVTEEQQEELKKLEFEMEYNNVLPIEKNIILLKKLMRQGEHIVLISDMYLHESYIRKLLCRVDTIFMEIPIYVSSTYGVMKGTGELFKVVKRQENVEVSDWIHYGDNIYADIEPALKLGIKAVQINAEHLTEYEHPNRNIYFQLSVGASRYIRSLEKKNVVYEVGSSLAGPILYPYINWVLKESRKRNIHRLYFVARDGWILKQIADVIIYEKKYSIKTKYIYGSRKVWRLPSYEGTKKDFDRIVRWSNLNEVMNIEDLAEIFQISASMLNDFLPGSFRNNLTKQHISTIEVVNLCQQLRESERFRKYLVKTQEEKRKRLICYLQQEFDVSDERFAFVELAGTGLTQKCLARIINSFYDGKIRNFYFKLDSIQEEDRCQFINFYPSNMKRSYMLELLCRAPHGQTENYIEDAGKIVPVMEPMEGEQIRLYNIEKYRDAVLAYVRQMEYVYTQNKLECPVKIDIVKEYMEVIAVRPPKRIAEYFCHMPFSAGGRKNSMVEFAPAITHKQLRRIYFWKNEKNPLQIYHGNCLEYALATSDDALKYIEKYKRFRENIIGKHIISWQQGVSTSNKMELDYFIPWDFFYGNIIIYGAGKIGQACMNQAKQRQAKCKSVLWVDSNYSSLQKDGLTVKSPEQITEYTFDRIIIAVHHVVARQEIWDNLRAMGIEAEKIYYG